MLKADPLLAAYIGWQDIVRKRTKSKSTPVDIQGHSQNDIGTSQHQQRGLVGPYSKMVP